MKDAGRRITFAVVSVLVSLLPFLSALDLFHWLVKMFKGLASFGALFALFPLSIVELAFVIVIGAYYRSARTRVRLNRRFLSVVGIELFLAFLFEAARFVTLRLRSGITLSIYADVRPPLYTVTAVVSLVVAAVLIGVSFLVARRRAA